MALADIPTGEQSRRLDSWKEIAEYLGRDVRTAARWESEGLPLHRVPGGKGRSVFGFTDEIDAWMAGHVAAPAAPVDAAPLLTADADSGRELPSTADPATPKRRFKTIAIGAACTLAVIAVGVAIRSRDAVAPLDVATLRVTATATEVSIADASRVSRVIHRFQSGGSAVASALPRIEDLDADGTPEILVGVSFYDNTENRSIRQGELLSLSTAGAERWRFAFGDILTFGDGVVRGPWLLADWQVGNSSSHARIAVAAHDSTWWASMVAVLDRDGRRLGTFVNPGWVESLLWLGRDRLAIGGFNNMRDEAIFALLDVNRLDGQAPGADGTAFACLSCSSAAPLLYATFARSELNRLTAARFNRARVSTVGDKILVTTSETERANAIYEFDLDLRLVRAQYSESYWDEHRRLELEGHLTHAREACPERNGPPAIHLWNGAGGQWQRTLPLKRY
jgi:hypothetical protein